MTQFIISLDIDWAPDWMIDEAASILIENKVKATWFATHQSPSIENLISEKDLFEVGVHPNFFHGSSQGGDPREVMTTLKQWFPDAQIVRAHSLYQSEKHLQMMCEEFNIKIDCSIFLKDTDNVTPHTIRYSEKGEALVRVPHVFQDNMHILDNLGVSKLKKKFMKPGLKVLNFHPVHLVLNSSSLRNYNLIKESYVINKLKKENIQQYIEKKDGVLSFYKEIINELYTSGSSRISDYVDEWLRRN